jgi:hypothetical protein
VDNVNVVRIQDKPWFFAGFLCLGVSIFDLVRNSAIGWDPLHWPIVLVAIYGINRGFIGSPARATPARRFLDAVRVVFSFLILAIVISEMLLHPGRHSEFFRWVVILIAGIILLSSFGSKKSNPLIAGR